MSAYLSYLRSLGTYLARHSLQHLILHVTNHCNLRCRHCFVDFATPKTDLSLEQYQALARQLPELYWLDIGGGEPFLRKDLAEICTAFNAGVTGIPTNGTLPDRAVEQLRRLRTLSPTEPVVSLSLDGLQATHDQIRGQQGNWEQVWATCERLRSIEGVSLKITTVITQQNVEEIIPLMREVRAREVDFHSVILLRGERFDSSVTLPPMARLQELGRAMFEILGTYDYGKNPLAARLLRNYHRYLWGRSLATLEHGRQEIPCVGGKGHAVVWGDGAVASCEMLPPVGDITRQSWAEIRQSDTFRQQVRMIEKGGCHCTHNCAMLDSILLSPLRMARLLGPVELP